MWYWILGGIGLYFLLKGSSSSDPETAALAYMKAYLAAQGKTNIHDCSVLSMPGQNGWETTVECQHDLDASGINRTTWTYLGQPAEALVEWKKSHPM